MDGEEATKPMSMNVNLVEEELVPIAESSIDPQPNPMTIGPTPFT